MKICLDLRALQIGHENRGIGMYVKSVLQHMPEDDNQYILYTFDKNNPLDVLNIKPKFDYKIVTTPTVKTTVDKPNDIFHLLRLVNHRFKPLKHERPDAFVQFDFMLSIPRWRRLKNVVIAYDLIPLIKRNRYLPSPTFAWQHSAGKRAKIKAVLRSVYYLGRYRIHYKVFKRAAGILAISEDAKQSFVDLLGIREAKITALPLAPVLSSGKADETVSRSIGKPFIFYVGGTDSRKNIRDIVHAFHIARGRGKDIALVLAGNEFKEIEKLPDVAARNAIIKSPYGKDIHLVGFITDEQKQGLYKQALAFVFCSSYEGFGLPVIEAMASGCPVISYDNSSIPEAAGDAAILVKTGSYVSVAEAISRIDDPSTRDALIRKGIKQSKKFSWDTYVHAFLAAVTRP